MESFEVSESCIEKERTFSTVSLDKNTFRNYLILILILLLITYLFILYMFLYIFLYILYSLRSIGRKEGGKNRRKEETREGERKEVSRGGRVTVSVAQRRQKFLFKPFTRLSLVGLSEINFRKTSVFSWF